MDSDKRILGLLASISRNLVLFLYALFALVPLIWLVLLSFKRDEPLSTTAFVFRPTLDNFRAVLGQEGFLWSLWNNLVVSSLAVALSLIVGVPTAYALSRYQFRGRAGVAFTVLSVRFAPEILVIIPLYVIYQNLGLIDSLFGLIWVYQLISLPVVIWILRGFFEDISSDIDAAAQVDGYSWWQVFFKVLLPMVRPGIVAAALLCFIFCWNSFTFALQLGGASVRTSTVSATSFLAADTVHYGWVAAAALLSALPGVVLAHLIQTHLARGLSFGAVKG
jgi:multiple sugar transport system permease protein